MFCKKCKKNNKRFQTYE